MIKSFTTDHRNDVKTPKGTNVEAWVTDEMTDNERAYWDGYYITRYPNAVMMPTIDYNHSSTRTFNCHGYAWDIVEKWQGVNEARWIGYINNDPEYKYWQDGSYIESTSPVYPGKANWSNGDHSAVTTSTSGVLISKWGSGPLMRHNWNYSPYGSSGIKYYKLSPPTITGNSPLCFSNQSSYTETKFTGNIDLTYQWSCNGLVSAAGLSNQSAYNVVATSGPSFGEASVTLTVTTLSGATSSATKNIWVGIPRNDLITVNGPYCVETNNYGYYYASAPAKAGVTEYLWDVQDDWTLLSAYSNSATIQAGQYPTVALVNAKNKCGWSIGTPYICFLNTCGGYYYSMYPNPASNQVTFEFSDPSTLQTSDAILSESSKNILNADPSGVKTGTVVETVDIKIYDKNQAIVLRSAGTTADQISIDTSLLASGIYYTHVTVGEKLYVRKLLIEGF